MTTKRLPNQILQTLPSAMSVTAEGLHHPLSYILNYNYIDIYNIFKYIKKERSSLFSISAITVSLLSKGYPIEKIQSFVKCGSFLTFLDSRSQKEKYNILHTYCVGDRSPVNGCFDKVFKAEYRCNLRSCSVCSSKRQKRVFSSYLPKILLFRPNSLESYYFLTISPRNYSNLEKGYKNIRSGFKKFLKYSYIQERIKGGLYAIETKNIGQGWNIHLHSLIFSRLLDNKIRGKCLDCGQSYIKKDHITKKFYCASRKCNSLNLKLKSPDSTVVRLAKKAFGRDVNVDIKRKYRNNKSGHTLSLNKNPSLCLNYITKYFKMGKEDFSCVDDLTDYIIFANKKPLINSFGCFYHYKTDVPQRFKKPFLESSVSSKLKSVCRDCGSEIKTEMDLSLCQEIGSPEPSLDVQCSVSPFDRIRDLCFSDNNLSDVLDVISEKELNYLKECGDVFFQNPTTVKVLE